MKKILAFCFLLLCIASFSFAQIFTGEAATKNGTEGFSLHYVDYADYRCLLFIDGVSIFIKEDQIAHLEAILEKFADWEEIANAEQIFLNKTIDSITFTSFHFSHTFFREPLVFYFVFTGILVQTAGSFEGSDLPPIQYILFVDTTLDRIDPFRLSSKTIQEMREALTPEKLSEAWDAYENQKALEEMFQ